MDWLLRPPDINTIEHAWDCLQRRIVASNVHCGPQESLERELVDDRALYLLRTTGSWFRACAHIKWKLNRPKMNLSNIKLTSTAMIYCEKKTISKFYYPTHNV